MMAGCDLLELSRHLKQERLYLSSERELLHRLHEEVLHAADQLYHVSWITRQQKHNLQQLILANKNVTPKMCSLRANSLEHVKFVDGYKYLSYHESKIGEFLKQLCGSPHVLAICLMQAEQASFDNMQKLAQIIVGGLYGNMVMQEDENHLLQVLKALIELQIATSDSPRRLLRKSSCAFSVMFKLFNEGLFSGKLFLTAGLRQPVMQLLMEDEWFYDIDPSRALHRFPTHERIRRFSAPDSKEYEEKTRQYRELTTNKLVMLTERFIDSIRSNMHCFPPSLAWLISQLYHNFMTKGQVRKAEARVMCADLAFTLFICPAICEPEPYGITSDAPISYIARHNLMQVAQILQVLAMSSSCDQVDSKTRDLYQKFPEGCMSFLLDELLEGPCVDEPHRLQSALPDFHKTAVLLTLTDLTDMLNVIRQAASCLEEDDPVRKQVETWLDNLPSAAILNSLHSRHATPNSTPQGTPPGTPSSSKKILKGRDRRRLLPNHLEPPGVSGSDSDDGSTPQSAQVDDVLVISLGVPTECPGMLPEHKVFEQTSHPPCRAKCNSLVPGEDNPICESEIHFNEKRTRFSLSHDQDSIATSDNLEAISEAASSHSAASDIENDNLSDMVSANVSGRGTPSISGRDTPISQEESQAEGVEEERRVPNLPVTVQKTNREDVTDRFGKFDIKQELERDETKSTVSDTWSTDVLASDSEPPEQNQLERLEEVAEEMARQNLLAVGVAEVFEPSETASDAWSTDVLASDTSERQADRLLELDQDELASLSSRGQGPDDVDLEEQREDREDTPQASAQVSGSGSPKDSVGHLDDFMGSRSADTPPSCSGGMSDDSPGRRTLDNGTDDDDIGDDRKHTTPMNSLSKVTFDITATGHNNTESSMAPSVDMSPSHDFDLGRLSDASVDSLTRDVAEGLKLTEQQNVKIDENRLSATIGLFDPLMQESIVAGRPPRRSLPTECLVTLLPTPLNARSYSGQGARPKVAFRPIQDVQINEPQSDGHMSLLQKPESAVNSLFDVTDGGNRSSSGSSDKMSTSSANDGSNSRSHSFDSGGPLVDIPGTTLHLDVTSMPSHSTTPDAKSSASLEDRQTVYDKAPATQMVPCTVLKEYGDCDDQGSDGKKKPTTGFFRSFKERLSKGGKRKLSKQFDRDEAGKLVTQSMDIDRGAGGDGNYDVLRPMSAPSSLEEPLGREVEVLPGTPLAQETSDDILAKYRKPKVAEETIDQPANPRQSRLPSATDDDDESLAYDPLNLETCKAFVDAKKKLRLVLSTLDPQMVPMMHGVTPQRAHHRDNELIAFLQILLAEALNLQDHDAIAQLHETIRCLRQFEPHETKKLLKSMKEEYRNRSPYVTYLVRCRQGLLATLACLERMLCRAHKDKVASNKYFLSVFVRLFLEKRERSLMKFIADFQKFTVADEKTDLLEKYLMFLHKQMEQESTWQGASERQMEEARVYIERHVMSHIYTHAMFPNGEGDFMRDQILHKHMSKLAQVITPNHKDLRIAKMYHYECPWPAAQAEIFMINVYKTPADKLQCAVRCASIIMNLLSMANEKSVPAADDFIPVLIYILIKANPPCLLSTVQYVTSFYEKRLCGEEQYWWTQLTSAIEFIKTMDYGS